MTEYKERHKAGGGEVTYRVSEKGGQKPTGQERGSSNFIKAGQVLGAEV